MSEGASRADQSSYSARDAAALLGVSPDAILRKCKGGGLREVESVGRGTHVSREDVEQLRAELLHRLVASDARAQTYDLRTPSPASAVQKADADGRSRDLARIRELEEYARGLKEMLEAALNLVGQRLVGDSLND